MKILITGAGGQLGREWVHSLEKTEHTVLALNSADLDITDAVSTEQKVAEFEPDLLINCAAYTAVDRAEEEPEAAFLVNETGAENLAAACKKNGAKLVHYSTDYVFEGSRSDQEKLPGGYREDHSPNPQNIYGKSKRAGEKAIEKVFDNWLIIRVSWLCGRYGKNFIKTILRLAGEKEQLPVVNDQTGSPTYCFDVVEKTIRLVELNQKGYFHISSEGETTWFSLARELIDKSGLNTEVKPVSSGEFTTVAERPAFSYLNTDKIRALGLEPAGWKEGLYELLNQLKIPDNED